MPGLTVCAKSCAVATFGAQLQPPPGLLPSLGQCCSCLSTAHFCSVTTMHARGHFVSSAGLRAVSPSSDAWPASQTPSGPTVISCW